ncbi:MAG: YdeI/OmpD-associated family protein [Thermoleophilaceae bacterium]|nr:YdeI/OmpD-associated family protein [Thermoleophilaceae bacterium]
MTKPDLPELTFSSPEHLERWLQLNHESRVQTAKKPETRARRIAKFVDELAPGDKPYP